MSKTVKIVLVVVAALVVVLFVLPMLTNQPSPLNRFFGPPTKNPTSAQTANTPNGWSALASIVKSPAGQSAIQQGFSGIASFFSPTKSGSSPPLPSQSDPDIDVLRDSL
jgi:hypothetical protein